MTAFDCLQSDTKLSDKEKRLMVTFLELKGFDLKKYEDWQYSAFRRSFLVHELWGEVDREYILRELDINKESHERYTK